MLEDGDYKCEDIEMLIKVVLVADWLDQLDNPAGGHTAKYLIENWMKDQINAGAGIEDIILRFENGILLFLSVSRETRETETIPNVSAAFLIEVMEI